MLPNYRFPLSIILEEVDKNEITLDDDMSATGFPSSSTNVTLSPTFDDLACGIVDHMDVIYMVPILKTTIDRMVLVDSTIATIVLKPLVCLELFPSQVCHILLVGLVDLVVVVFD